MKIFSTYSVKIHESNKAFYDTAEKYREAVSFFIEVAVSEWDTLSKIEQSTLRVNALERLAVRTKKNPNPKYDFSSRFFKFPSYLRRAAISEALGKASSYKSNYENWLISPQGKKEPGAPKAGFVYPAMYRDNMFVRTGTYTASIKVWIRNTWDWMEIQLKKSDVDYINRHCHDYKECVPTLQKRGKNWYLDFGFEMKKELVDKPIEKQIILGVDLGINSACVCTAMLSDGTVLGRKFLTLPREEDSLRHALGKIKKAQRHGARKMPRLWAKAKGINSHITSLTAQFIMDVSHLYHADVVVFEHLDIRKKKRGSRRQRLHHWKAMDVQRIVTDKAHRTGMHVSHVCAWNTSRLAFDGSGRVERDADNYSMCTFTTSKRYNCDLSASYNIAARYFVREIIKSLPVRTRQRIEAKVPGCVKRTTCTLSTLISLSAELSA